MFGRKIIAELAEIGENLVRSPLTPAQEASAIFRRKAIYEELHPETKHGGNSGGPFAQFAHTEAESFPKSTAAVTGKHRATIDRASARGEALGDDLAAIAGTSLDKGVELDAMAKTRIGPNPSYQTAARCSWRKEKSLPRKLIELPPSASRRVIARKAARTTA
jgi:hypothetical protein